MFQKLSNSWQLVKASARVLEADKELLVFPAISGAALVAVTATLFLPVALFAGSLSAPIEGSGPLAWIVLFFYYCIQYSIIIFFNSALVGAALIRLDGGDPTVSDGLRIARQRLGSILGYAVIAATVGLLLKAARDRSDNMLSSIATSLVGFAWNLATFLVVPVLVTHDIGPIEALKKSASILKKTWGEQVVGNAGFGLLFGLLGFGLVILAVPSFVFVAAIGQGWMVPVLIVFFVLAFLTLMLVNATLSGIYSAALYRYATTGHSEMFDDAQLSRAFTPR